MSGLIKYITFSKKPKLNNMDSKTSEQLALCEAIKATFLKYVGDEIVSDKISKELHTCLVQMKSAIDSNDVPLLNLSGMDEEDLEFVGLKRHGEYMLIPSWLIPFTNSKDKLFFVESGEELGLETDLDEITVNGVHTNVGIKDFVK
jgi:hypothetical protein